MKKLLFTLMLMPTLLLAQNPTFFEAYQEYVDDCNELVLDTITQSGTIEMKYIPVEMNGVIDHFKLAPIDTVWNDYHCPEYKSFLSFSSGIDEITQLQNFGSYYTNVNTCNYTVKSSEKMDTKKVSITREVVCTVKKRMPTFEDFLGRWCVEKGYL